MTNRLTDCADPQKKCRQKGHLRREGGVPASPELGKWFGAREDARPPGTGSCAASFSTVGVLVHVQHRELPKRRTLPQFRNHARRSEQRVPTPGRGRSRPAPTPARRGIGPFPRGLSASPRRCEVARGRARPSTGREPWGGQTFAVRPSRAGEAVGSCAQRFQQPGTNVGRQPRAQRGADRYSHRNGPRAAARGRRRVAGRLARPRAALPPQPGRREPPIALTRVSASSTRKPRILHLAVDAAKELQLAAIGSPAGRDRRCDRDACGRPPSPARAMNFSRVNSGRPGSRGPAPMPPRPQFAGPHPPDGPELLIQNASQVVRHRLADGDGLVRMALAASGDDGGFGRPISVEDAAPGPPPTLHQVRADRFRRQESAAARGDILVHHGEQRGRTRAPSRPPRPHS